MSRITEITRRDIFDLFRYGVEQNTPLKSNVNYPYNGRLYEVEFLSRVYDLKSMPSYDSRQDNAENDIACHTYFGDYPEGWVFEDERFDLLNCSDEILLKFLSEIFHPAVRNDKLDWKIFLKQINELLYADGYELFVKEKISAREVYGWRLIDKNQNKFVPFSIRNQSDNIIKKNEISIPKKVRKQIYNILDQFNENISLSNNGEFRTISNTKLIRINLSEFYVPQHYDASGKYVEATSLKGFIESTSPFCVLDALESFSRTCTKREEFERAINNVFKSNNLSIELYNSKINLTLAIMKIDKTIQTKDISLEKLLEEAESFYNKKQYSYAVEKIWDAFERIKTYYSPNLNKKQSAEKIVNKLSCDEEDFKDIFAKEFQYLTRIGNEYRIRHHEKGKKDIVCDIHYKYLYNRCLSLIEIVRLIIA